jgi:hypothetical protein
MMQIMKDVGGVEMPEYFGKLAGADGAPGERDRSAAGPRSSGAATRPAGPGEKASEGDGGQGES